MQIGLCAVILYTQASLSRLDRGMLPVAAIGEILPLASSLVLQYPQRLSFCRAVKSYLRTRVLLHTIFELLWRPVQALGLEPWPAWSLCWSNNKHGNCISRLMKSLSRNGWLWGEPVWQGPPLQHSRFTSNGSPQ